MPTKNPFDKKQIKSNSEDAQLEPTPEHGELKLGKSEILRSHTICLKG